MATTYSETITKVRTWANRDAEALPDVVIQDSLRWAADTAYRNLMIPPLEFTQDYLVVSPDVALTNLPAGTTEVLLNDVRTQQYSPPANVVLPIPSDTTSFIQLRVRGTAMHDGNTLTLDSNDCIQIAEATDTGVVFNEKVDVRTYNDYTANVVSDGFWTRQQDNILLSGLIQPFDIVELYYFRRLPALDARYLLTSEDFDDSFMPLTTSASFIETTTYTAETRDALIALNLEPGLTDTDFFQPTVEEDTPEDLYYLGTHIDHWLRDDNQRIILFGALNECFSYLADDAQAQKYLQKYTQEIGELNKEEKVRKSSGGNVQVHYNSILI